MLRTGLSATVGARVDETNTALAAGSGDLPVLATPAMIALMENAAMRAVAPELGEESTTVGASVQVRHLRATPLGEEVRVRATVTALEGRRIVFNVEACDAQGPVGEGEHVRYVVDRARFMAKIG